MQCHRFESKLDWTSEAFCSRLSQDPQLHITACACVLAYYNQSLLYQFAHIHHHFRHTSYFFYLLLDTFFFQALLPTTTSSQLCFLLIQIPTAANPNKYNSNKLKALKLIALPLSFISYQSPQFPSTLSKFRNSKLSHGLYRGPHLWLPTRPTTQCFRRLSIISHKTNTGWINTTMRSGLCQYVPNSAFCQVGGRCLVFYTNIHFFSVSNH